MRQVFQALLPQPRLDVGEISFIGSLKVCTSFEVVPFVFVFVNTCGRERRGEGGWGGEGLRQSINQCSRLSQISQIYYSIRGMATYAFRCDALFAARGWKEGRVKRDACRRGDAVRSQNVFWGGRLLSKSQHSPFRLKNFVALFDTPHSFVTGRWCRVW